METEQTKTCNVCKQNLSISKFGVRDKKTGKLRNECKECRSKAQKAWADKNKDKRKEYNKQYRKENKEQISEQRKQYYEENKEILSEKHKQYWAENKEVQNIKHKQWESENKEKIKTYRSERKEHYTELHKQWREKNSEKARAYSTEYSRQWSAANKEKHEAYHKKYREENREAIRESYKAWAQTPAAKEAWIRHKAKRRNMGCDPINEYFSGSEFHHLWTKQEGELDDSIGIYIPADLHKSIPHNHNTWSGMEEMNTAALEWLDNQKNEILS